MSITITTVEGDFLDDLIAQHYGVAATSAGVSAVLDATPGLAERGPVLPAEIRVVFPDLAPATSGALRLWD